MGWDATGSDEIMSCNHIPLFSSLFSFFLLLVVFFSSSLLWIALHLGVRG